MSSQVKTISCIQYCKCGMVFTCEQIFNDDINGLIDYLLVSKQNLYSCQFCNYELNDKLHGESNVKIFAGKNVATKISLINDALTYRYQNKRKINNLTKSNENSINGLKEAMDKLDEIKEILNNMNKKLEELENKS
jgi:hypothetical protein